MRNKGKAKYVCPKCGMEYDVPGKCEMCHVKLEKATMHQGHMKHEMHDHTQHHEMMVRDFKKRFFISLALSMPVIALASLAKNLAGLTIAFVPANYVLLALSAVIFLYGGWPFLKGSAGEIKGRKPGMMTLVAFAITIAFLYSAAVVFGLKGGIFFLELVTLVDIMLLGHWIEMRSILGASRALGALAELMPAEAHLVKPGKIEDVPLSTLKAGDIVLVKPGEKMPSDGTVIKGETTANESMITGESKPVSKRTGSKVIGGSVNGEGAIQIKVSHTGKDSYLSQVISLVKKAQESKSKTQDLADRAAMWLTMTAMTVGTATLVVWLYMDKGLAFSLERLVTVVVIACPHALGLAIPLVVSVSTSLSAKNGLLIRNRTAFEAARNIDAVIFDKTGTLTKGEFGVTDIVALGKHKEKDLLWYAASLEANSEHPISKGIVQKARSAKIKLSEAKKFKALPGKGVQGTVRGKQVNVVGLNYLKEENMKADDKKIEQLAKQGKTVAYVIINDEIAGAIALADLIREESKEAISKLKGMGIKCMMLTGDNRQVAAWVANELGLDDYFAEVLPHQKAESVKKVQGKGFKVAMVGDGINDAPALVQADVGIAIGAGTEVAIESADIILVRNDPRDVASITGLAKKTYSKMKQNLLWATGYNVIAIPLAAGVLYSKGLLLSPALGAVFMSISTIIVAINARLLSLKK